ncbi:MAG: alpha-galactosidase [Clostridia bacterium]|nr:alpha-galactosidase [Clostridia bacterium]
MRKIAFIGAGSFGFTRTLVKDILSFEAFNDCELALMDIDDERLEFIEKAVHKIVEKGNYKAKVTATKDRVEALRNADGVVCTVLAGDVDVWRNDIEIPKKYGVDINVGDTRGPAGIFRFLRTYPLMMSICRDIEKYCPDAIFLNYTNPMAMLCRAMQGQSNVNVTGLCHSVQGTAEMLAEWIGAPINEVEYLCAGINHQAFYLEYKWNGKDAYPLIKEAIEKPEIYQKELVRNEMYKHLDYYVTESSGHNSEYNAWFRKRPDLIEKYCLHGTNWNPGVYGYIKDEYLKRKDNWKHDIIEWLDKEDIDITRGHEYAAFIFNAVFGDNSMFKFNGNVQNFGLIENLPYGCCVEVPVLASKGGLEKIAVGKMPDHLAVLLNISARCEELVVNGAIEGDKKKIYQAIYFDPLTSAVLSLDEIKQMVDEMFEFNKEYLSYMK